MSKIVLEIRKELKKHVDKKYKAGAEWFFNESIKCHGVRVPVVRRIGQRYYPKDETKKEIFKLCEEMLRSDFNEEATIAFAWAYKLKKEYSKEEWKIFTSWLNKYVNNWAKCDDFCTHAFGHLLYLYPEYLKTVKGWTKSKNRWLRRAAAVIMIYPTCKDKKFLKDNLIIADKLLLDQDDLVQKGYGWMLKEAANRHQVEIFQYVMKHKDKMPRTALRYAIEKMSINLKKQAMKKIII